MSQAQSGFTKQTALNMFYGGSVFFALLFAVIVFDTEQRIPERSNAQAITPAVIAGKKIWETRNCIGCHTLLGEGAYFAPELGNVMKRWKVQDDPAAATEMLKGWMTSMPTGIEGRRQMPHFNLTDEEFKNLADFLLWTGKINTQNWPPNDAG